MWNKQIDHPMVTVNEQLPLSARIEDEPSQNKPKKTSTSKILESLEKASEDRQKQSSERLDAIKNLYSDLLGEKDSDITFDISTGLGDLNVQIQISIRRGHASFKSCVTSFQKYFRSPK
jgi:hypothetical protein